MTKLKNEFAIWDYLVFVAMLVISSGIGIFFAFKGGKTQGEYLLGNRSMPIIPVAISILVSYMSAILILGTPAEMYTQGAQFYISLIGMVIGVSIAALLFVPLFFPLKITSVFEYLERRFESRATRLLGTAMMMLSQVLYVGAASFAPSIAFEAVTGFPVWATIIITGVIGTFYTTIGGMKAVIWTDVFQAVIMLSGMLAIVVQGTLAVGGMNRVWEINDQWSRLNFWNWDVNPTTRHTVWNLIIGSAVNWVGAFGMGQASVQRYCSLPTMGRARLSVLLNTIGLFILVSSACVSGIVLFAYYAGRGCDPLGANQVDSSNQLIPYFVMEVLGYPGVPGLFIACLFSGALSSVSSSLSALAAITWEDILKPHIDKRLSEPQKTALLKVLVIVYGCLGIGTGFIFKQLEGTMLQAAMSFLGGLSGPLTGLFVLGAFFPWANRYGALAGGICGLTLSLWLSVGSYVHGIPKLDLPYPNDTCYIDSNSSLATMTNTSVMAAVSNYTIVLATGDQWSPLDSFYRISYMWFASVGIGTVVIVGVVVSFITGANSIEDVPTKYQIPFFSRLFCCLPKSVLFKLNCCRDFKKPEDIRSDEKDVEIIIPPPGPQSSGQDKKSGLDNKGYDNRGHSDTDNHHNLKDYGLPAYRQRVAPRSGPVNLDTPHWNGTSEEHC